MPVDCGALPRTLFEREIFRHHRGAFTDAYREQRGLVAMADGGSLLLDEVDTLSMEAQAALLRVLEDGTYRPLGAERFSNVNVRIISASNVDLDRAVGEGRFRADLFFRLAGVRLHLPALRERRQDIRLLAEHLLRMHQHQKQETSTLSVDAMRSLECYPWPGNVRELSNVIRNAIMVWLTHRIEPEDLELPLPPSEPCRPPCAPHALSSWGNSSGRVLDDLLRRCQGNLTHASRQAGQDRRALGRLVKKHALDPQRGKQHLDGSHGGGFAFAVIERQVTHDGQAEIKTLLNRHQLSCHEAIDDVLNLVQFELDHVGLAKPPLDAQDGSSPIAELD